MLQENVIVFEVVNDPVLLVPGPKGSTTIGCPS